MGTQCFNHYIEVSEKNIDSGWILRWIGDSSQGAFGAQTLFLGVVRNENLGKRVVGVSYDVFGALAEKTLLEICDEAQKKWGSEGGTHLKMAVVHRTGRLNVGEVSVAIAVGSPHRDESYQASRYIIEQIKERVPIWKQEHYENGDSEWLRGHALCAH